METIRKTGQQSLQSRSNTDKLKKELIDFLSRHPNRKYTSGIISCALDQKKGRVEFVLRELAEAELISSCIEGGCRLYALKES